MSSKMALVVVVIVILHSSLLRAMELPNTMGREFVFAIPSDYVYKRPSTQRVFLSSQTGQPVSASIVTSDRSFSRQISIPAYREAIVDLPGSLTSRGTGLRRASIGIRADGDITVHIQMDAGVNSGAFTPIPNKSLGRNYIIGIYEPLLPRYRSGFIVTAGIEGALLQITFSRAIEYGYVSYGPDRTFTFHLDAYESFQIMSKRDLTGTVINSDHPIAVVAGSECSQVPRGVKYCDYLVEQLPPVHTLGKNFIVAPFKDRQTSYVIRIVAPFNDTDVHFESDRLETLHLESTQHHDIIFDRQLELSFRSTKPILVLQFMKGFRSGDYVGDPSMVIVPSIEQFSASNLTFVSMAQDRVTITVTNSNITTGGLRINGERISRDWSVISDDIVTVIHGTLESGSHVISHIDPQAKFLVIGYGTGYLSSRAFPVAYNLKRLYVPSDEPLIIRPRGYHVRCLNVSMVVTLDRSVFLINNPNDVTLNNPNCKPIVDHDLDYSLVVLRTNYDSCNTNVQEYNNTVTFSNTLWFAESVITPIFPLRDLPFKCVIEQEANVVGISSFTSGGVQQDHSGLSDVIMGDLKLSLTQYMDDTFTQEASGNATGGALRDTILHATRGQHFFAVNVTSSFDAGVFIDSCWTTPGPDALDYNSKDIINEGCGIDDTIRIGASVDDPRFRPIAVDSFSAIEEYRQVFMHCRVQVCRGVDAATRCLQECNPDSRRRRDLKLDVFTLSTGPVKITPFA